jgi:hypothetical protein
MGGGERGERTFIAGSPEYSYLRSPQRQAPVGILMDCRGYARIASVLNDLSVRFCNRNHQGNEGMKTVTL